MPTNKKGYWSKNGGENYKKYQGSKKAMKDRNSRNVARRQAERDGAVKKGDGKEIDHKKPLSKGGTNVKSNRRIISRKTNRKLGAAIANKNKGRGYKKNKSMK